MHTLTPLVIKPSFELLTQWPNLFMFAQQLRQHYHTQQVTEAELKTVGMALWQALNLNIPLTSQTIVIEQQGNALDDLPWECLYHPQLGFLAKQMNYTLSRRIEGNHAVVNPPPFGPLNILLWTAQPQAIRPQQAWLDLEREKMAVRIALEPFIAAGWVKFYASDDGSFTSLVEILSQLAWQVVLLSGHSILNPTNQLQSAGFIFEDDTGEGEFIAADILASIFQASTVQCVVIAACQSAYNLATPANLVMPLIQAGIPHVIGMRERLLDRAGQVFIQTLCVALAQQTRIDTAVQQARSAMTELLSTHETWDETHKLNSTDPSVGQWCLPILISHDLTQPLINWHFSPQPRLSPFIGNSIPLSPPLFLGRRQELRILGTALRTGTIRYLFIHGRAGIGKTTLAQRLILPLIQQNYRVLVYQANQGITFLEVLARVRGLSPTTTLEILLEPFSSQSWLLWLDNLDGFRDPDNGTLLDTSINDSLTILQRWNNPQLRLILTVRQPINTTLFFDNYQLNRPDFQDFSHAFQQLGLNYTFAERLKTYQVLGGSFQGIQLLQSLPLLTTDLTTQLAIVHRYLQAYQRSCNSL
jgi:CHAT domain-containing protein